MPMPGSSGGILGVVDGFPPLGVENEDDVQWRKDLLRVLSQ
jgi:adenosine/AMP kinase